MTRRQEIAEAALALLEEAGPPAATMRAVADRVGIRGPSLYKHYADKDALEAAVIALGFEAMAETWEGVGADLADLAAAYRRFALDRPHLYRLMTERPLRRDLLPPGLEDRAAAPIVAAMRDEAGARAVWAFAHGMVHLELAGRFPPGADLEAAWQAGVKAFSGR